MSNFFHFQTFQIQFIFFFVNAIFQQSTYGINCFLLSWNIIIFLFYFFSRAICLTSNSPIFSRNPIKPPFVQRSTPARERASEKERKVNLTSAAKIHCAITSHHILGLRQFQLSHTLPLLLIPLLTPPSHPLTVPLLLLTILSLREGEPFLQERIRQRVR